MKKTSYQLFMILFERFVKSGLPLVTPHPRLIWEGKKTAIVKKKKMDLSKFKILCDFGGKAYGFIRCREPKVIDLKRFKALEGKHLISEAEREKWWPGVEEFFRYDIRGFFPFEKPRRIRKPAAGTQTSIHEVVFKRKEFDPRVTAKELKALSDKDLVSLHGQVHSFWEERGSRPGDELVINCHLLIVEEMKRRGLEHRIQDGLDEAAAKLMGLHIDEDYVYLDDLDQIFGEGFYIKDLFLAGIGGVAVSGRGRDFDVWVNFPTGKDAVEKFLGDLEFRFRSFLNENLNEKINFKLDKNGEFAKFLEQEKHPPNLADATHLVPDPEGKFTNYLPLARLKVEFIPPEKRELIRMGQELKPGVPFQPLKSRTGYGRFSFYDKESLWKGWISKYLLKKPITPIAAEEKMDGIRLVPSRDRKRVWIFTEDKKRDRAPYLPDVVAEMKRLPVKSVILDSETVIWESGAPIPRHEMIRLVVSKKPLKDEEIHVNCFDCLYYNGKSLIDLPWKERQIYLKKVLPRDLKHLKRVEPCIITNRRTFDKCIERTSKAPGSEGAMLKSIEGKYDLKGRTGEWAKLKLTFELKVSVIGLLRKPFPLRPAPTSDLVGDEAIRTFKRLQEKSKTYILRAAFRDKSGRLQAIMSDHRLTPGNLSLKWDAAKKEWKGTEDPRIWQTGKGFPHRKHGEYAYGNTYAKKLDPGPKMGSIVTVRPIMMRKFQAEGKTMFSWMFPNLREIDPERTSPDTIEDVERIVRESAARTPGKKARMEIMKALHGGN